MSEISNEYMSDVKPCSPDSMTDRLMTLRLLVSITTAAVLHSCSILGGLGPVPVCSGNMQRALSRSSVLSMHRYHMLLVICWYFFLGGKWIYPCVLGMSGLEDFQTDIMMGSSDEEAPNGGGALPLCPLYGTCRGQIVGLFEQESRRMDMS